MLEARRSVLMAEGNAQERAIIAGRIRADIDCIVYEAATTDEAHDLLAAENIGGIVIGPESSTPGATALFGAVLKDYSQTLAIPVIPLGEQQALVQALVRGAFTYLNHPYHPTEAVITVSRALAHHDLLHYQEKRGPKIRKRDGFHGIIGQSPAMCEIFALIDRLAEDGRSTVMILGESGTGKELVARAIHSRSARQTSNFVPVNCAAIPDELLESELFGYRKGAFTGAVQSKMGQFQYAEGGTLFLDEIGDMPLGLQAKLLRVLQERTIVPVGGFEPIPVDVRIVSATHQNLPDLVAQGHFREDLYHRLNVIPLLLPALRERPDDIPQLLEKFVQIFNRNRRERLVGFSTSAVATLQRYPWPGNVRELENFVQRMVVLHPGAAITASNLPQQYQCSEARSVSPAAAGPLELPLDFGADGIDFDGTIHGLEDRLIYRALVLSQGNKKEAARLLNLKRTTLLEKMKKKGLSFP